MKQNAELASPASEKMMHWQYKRIVGELLLLQQHATDQSCPCELVTEEYEACIPKHLLTISQYCLETIPMTDEQKMRNILESIAGAADDLSREYQQATEEKRPYAEIAEFARESRKQLEPYLFTYKMEMEQLRVCTAMQEGKMEQPRVCTAMLKQGPILTEAKVMGALTKTPVDATRRTVFIRTSDDIGLVLRWEEGSPVVRFAGDPNYEYRVSKGWRPALIQDFQTLNRRGVAIQKRQTLGNFQAEFERRLAIQLQEGVPLASSVIPKAPVTPEVTEVARQKPPSIKVKIAGTCLAEKECAIKVKAVEETEQVATAVGLPSAIDAVIRKMEEKRKPKGTPKTFALGPNQLTRYEFEYRLAEADDLLASHNAFTFQPEPNYPPELQPRLRGRAINKAQVINIAQNLDPEALLGEFHSIDRGAPIVGEDLVVESGNGRVMGIKHAIGEFPEAYATYRQALEAEVSQYALSAEEARAMRNPILVRVRLTIIDRRAFVEEANASTVLTPSAIEVARSDAGKLTHAMLASLDIVGEESIDDALRSARNAPFVTAFLAKLPEAERGQLSDAQGRPNQDGIRRLTMAIFAFSFPGDTGLRLAEKFFESTEPTVRNTFNGLMGSLGVVVQAEALSRAGERNPDLAIGEDIAYAVSVFATIKKTPGMTVEKYLAQIPMFEAELDDFQKRLLRLIDERGRSGKRIAELFRSYAQVVLDSPHPAQAALFPDGLITKAEALERAVTRAEIPILLQRPRWCMGVARVSKDLNSLRRRVNGLRGIVQKAKDSLTMPQQICAGQAEMLGTMMQEEGKVVKIKQDPILSEVARQICGAGVCMVATPDSPKPICTASEAKKLERCITKVKARNVKAGCRPEGTGTKKCPVPWAVCQESVGCRPGRGE